MRYFIKPTSATVKSFFAIGVALVFFLNVFISDAAAKRELVVGEFSYTYGDSESLAEAKKFCKKNAIRAAIESAMVYVRSTVKVNASGIKSLDLYSLGSGCLQNVKVLEEKITGREIYYRVQGNIDVERWESKLQEFISKYRITAGRKVRISFYTARIEQGQACARDDSKPAPDVYVMAKDRQGNVVFRTDHVFLDERKYGRLFKNRNNYTPEFEGASFTYTFIKADPYLDVYLVDWDGLEGFLGRKKSPDDIIGTPLRIGMDHPLGKRWIGEKGWKLEMEIVEIN